MEVLVNRLVPGRHSAAAAFFFKIHVLNSPIHGVTETGSLRLKGRAVGSKVNRSVKASERDIKRAKGI